LSLCTFPISVSSPPPSWVILPSSLGPHAVLWSIATLTLHRTWLHFYLLREGCRPLAGPFQLLLSQNIVIIYPYQCRFQTQRLPVSEKIWSRLKLTVDISLLVPLRLGSFGSGCFGSLYFLHRTSCGFQANSSLLRHLEVIVQDFTSYLNQISCLLRL
jgi:hypothetical protein